MKTAKPHFLPHNTQWIDCENSTLLALSMAKNVAQQLAQALVIRPRASLAVSGGRTPLAMLKQLSLQNLDWHRVDITLADERWVDENHASSNAALVRANLVQNKAKAATFYPLFNGEVSAHLGQKSCQTQLEKMHWPLDVLVLGMGNDGHTASLFPHCSQLQGALTAPMSQLCINTQAPTAPSQRMSLTAPTLLSATHKHLHIEGEEKHRVLQQAMTIADPLKMPIFAVLQTPLTIHWCP
ncbi:MAG: 6-phosphogluconolactonase [Oceanospirillaceae bacterium]|jgi:6-phosphogluconolactonase